MPRSLDMSVASFGDEFEGNRSSNHSSTNGSLYRPPSIPPPRENSDYVSNIPILDFPGHRTIIIERERSNIVFLTMRGPCRPDGLRCVQEFVLDRNTSMSDSMAYVRFIWGISDRPSLFQILDLNNVDEPLRQICPSDIIRNASFNLTVYFNPKPPNKERS